MRETTLGDYYLGFGGCACGLPLAIYAWAYAVEDFGFWGFIFGWVAAIPAFFIGALIGPVAYFLVIVAGIVIGAWWLLLAFAPSLLDSHPAIAYTLLGIVLLLAIFTVGAIATLSLAFLVDRTK